MKALFITLLTFISFVSIEANQDKTTITAIFDGYENDVYYFSADGEEEFYEFQQINSVASKKYDLKDAKFKGKNFEVTYTTETELDEDDEEYTLFTIVDLKLNE